MAEEANMGERVFGASLVNTGFSRIFFLEGEGLNIGQKM